MEEEKEAKESERDESKKAASGFDGRWELDLRLDPDFPMDWRLRW